jgi:small conductance mechanosensitive channel
VSNRTRQWCFTDEPGGETIRWDGMPVTIVQTLRERAAARAAERGRGAARQALLLLPLLAAVLLAYVYRAELFGLDAPVRVAGLFVVVLLGWAFARSVGRALGPVLFRRFSPSTAGTLGFFIRLATLALVVGVALYVSGLPASQLVLGGAFAAAILGLAGQQTLGNLIAGIVLLSARPFRLGDRIRLEGGMLGGNHQVEGIVSSLGLLYTTLAPDEESITVPNTALAEAEGNIIVPNNLVLASTIVPLGELAAVELRVRLPRGVRPSEIQDRVADGVSVTLRSPPEVDIEQIDAQGVMARIAARPEAKTDGPQLADEVVSAIEGLMDGEPASNGRLDGDRPRQPQPVA